MRHMKRSKACNALMLILTCWLVSQDQDQLTAIASGIFASWIFHSLRQYFEDR